MKQIDENCILQKIGTWTDIFKLGSIKKICAYLTDWNIYQNKIGYKVNWWGVKSESKKMDEIQEEEITKTRKEDSRSKYSEHV